MNVDPVTGLVSFENVVEAPGANVVVFCYSIFGSIFIVCLFVSFKLVFHCFDGTGVKNVENTGVEDFVDDQRIVSAVMEYFQYVFVCK